MSGQSSHNTSRWSGPTAETVKNRIRAALRDNIASLAEMLFGPPTRRNRRSWRFPNAIEVDIAGPKRGRFVQWSSDAKGDPLEMIRFAHGASMPWPEVWDHAARFTGIPAPDAKEWTPEEQREWNRKRRERIEAERQRHATKEAREIAEKVAEARAIWTASTPTSETLGDHYLTTPRGIPAPVEGWADCIRWHPTERAVVFAATASDGEIEAVQAVKLKPDGTNQHRVDGSKIKLTHGSLANHPVVRLPATGCALSTALHAEGPETGLSAWRATGLATWIHLGAVSRAKLPAGRTNIILRDDDAPGGLADRQLEKALDAWREDGIRVAVATPWPKRRGDKSDFNDLLRAEGLDAVQARIRLAEIAAAGLTPAPAPFPLPTAGLREVRGEVARQVAQFMGHRLDELPPRVLLSGSTGSGKTKVIGDVIPNIIAADKHMGRPHRVIVAVPMHRLARQIIARFTEEFAGLRVAVYEGRGVSSRETEGPGEDAPLADGREPMCRNPLEVRLALAACVDVTKAVCGTSKKNGGSICRYRNDCRYWSQLGECSKADVVFLAHNFIFDDVTEHTEMVFANVGTIIIDEDPSTHGDGTVSLPMSAFGDGALYINPVLDKEGNEDSAKTAELQRHFVSITYALDQVEQGIALRDALATEGLTHKLLKQARGLNMKRQIAPGMWPGMPLTDREAAAARAGRINPVLFRMYAVLSALMEAVPAPDRTPDLFDDAEASVSADPADSPADTPSERVEVNGSKITVYRLRPVGDWVAERPVLLATATGRADLLGQHLPGLQHTPGPMPAAPFQTVHQHLGAFGKDAMRRKLPDLLAEARWLTEGKRALIVTHMPLAEAFAEALPDVAVRYHGGTVGDDDFGDTEVVLIYGGAFAKKEDVARAASAEAGRIIPPTPPVHTSCTALLADGTGVAFKRMAYADPVAQAVHTGIYDASVVQAIGRARGLNRTAADPVEIHSFVNVPLPMPVASINRSRRPSQFLKMMLAGHAPISAADMARVHPELFPSPEAARAAKYRWGGEVEVIAEYRRLADRLPWPTALITYQPAGQGFRPRRMVVVRDRIAEVQAELLREFGQLTGWYVETFSRGSRPIDSGSEHRDSPTKEGKKAPYAGPSHSSDATSPPPPPRAAASEARPPPN